MVQILFLLSYLEHLTAFSMCAHAIATVSFTFLIKFHLFSHTNQELKERKKESNKLSAFLPFEPIAEESRRKVYSFFALLNSLNIK